MTPALPHLTFSHPWSTHEISWSTSRGLLRMYNGDDVDVTAEVTRCLAGRLHNAYPVGAHDVEIGVDGAGSAASLATVLQCLSAAISLAEPNCRRIIYAVSAGQSRDSAVGERDVLRAAQTAGFRYVIDVETGDGEELKLCVVEPDWVTRADIDLDRVPNS